MRFMIIVKATKESEAASTPGAGIGGFEKIIQEINRGIGKPRQFKIQRRLSVHHVVDEAPRSVLRMGD